MRMFRAITVGEKCTQSCSWKANCGEQSRDQDMSRRFQFPRPRFRGFNLCGGSTGLTRRTSGCTFGILAGAGSDCNDYRL